MATEDFGTYTETDPNGRLTKTTRRVTFTNLTANEDAYVYIDKGVDFFDADFEIHTTLFITGTPVNGFVVAVLSLTNVIDDAVGVETGGGDALYARFLRINAPSPRSRLEIVEVVAGSATVSGHFGISINTPYFLKFSRDESVGANGTLYLRIYTDAARQVLSSTLPLTLTANLNLRNLFALQSFNSGSNSGSGYTENLALQGTLPKVTSQTATDIDNTTATGHGTIVDLGISAVTAHGYVWATTIDPDTGDSSTDEGAGSVGRFTSSITGLLVGQKYFLRPYATNGAGTGYGSNVTFITGEGGTQLIDGNLAVVQTRLHYVDKFGKERYIEGILT